MSLLFYSLWEPKYTILILISIVTNFLCGYFIQNSRAKKAILNSGLLFNLSLLGYYKYTNFFIENLDRITGAKYQLSAIALPLGISFFTFTQIAYLVDCYKAKVKETNFLNYFLFVTFFPHLIAGPIIHHAEMMPQFQKAEFKLNYNNIYKGLSLFAIGLFKKTIVADLFAFNVAKLFNLATVTHLSFWESWSAALSYSVQLYFDFSGYTDMAIGIALLFNIILPINFNSPYKADSISDFWQRWHITLSRFLREYIYIPLGGNRKGYIRREINVLLVFLIGGFWHGAGWTFIVWGILHSIGYIISRVWNSITNYFKFLSLPKFTYVLITFIYVTFCWVYFNASTVTSANSMIKSMLSLDFHSKMNYYIFPAIVVIAATMLLPNSNQIVEYTTTRSKNFAIAYAIIFWIGLIAINLIPNTPFIYFQF